MRKRRHPDWLKVSYVRGKKYSESNINGRNYVVKNKNRLANAEVSVTENQFDLNLYNN